MVLYNDAHKRVVSPAAIFFDFDKHRGRIEYSTLLNKRREKLSLNIHEFAIQWGVNARERRRHGNVGRVETEGNPVKNRSDYV